MKMMMKSSKIKQFIGFTLTCVLLVLMLSGCGQKSKKEENGFLVLVDKSGSKLVSVAYDIEAKETELQINELMKALQNYSGDTYASPILAGSLVSWEYANGNVNIYFNSSYNDLVVIDEALARAAVVKTLCQLEDVNLVYYYVDEVSLTIKGSIIGGMNEEYFIDDLNMNEGTVKLQLYFPNEDKSELEMVEREVTYNSAYTDEQMIVEELLKGPLDSEGGLVSAIPAGTELLNVVTRDRVCYVNFSEGFLEYLTDMPDEITIYSIVNTLTGFSTISSVVIMVEGTNLDTYNTYDCSSLLTFNYDIVAASEEMEQ